ncbi:hypothetical protein Tco_0481184 [Tanacetum coccineum]
MKLSQDMHLIQKLRDDQKCMKKAFEDVLGSYEQKSNQGRDHRFLALGWLLEEIHVTWAHLEKKRTRLRTYTKSLEDFCKQWLETASQA